MRFLITGTAGFIGFHLAQRLLADGHSVDGIDGVTPYYDQTLKRARLALLERHNGFTTHDLMLEEAEPLARIVARAKADIVVHLAAQAGVRYSAENPRAYIDSNITGTFNLIEALRARPCRHLLVASTSSVYGAATTQPFREDQRADEPLSLYAATKKSVEAIAHSYSHLHGLPMTIMRFFTVYGPWGRPDMALFKFTRNILEGQPIEVYGAGRQSRDFTYVTDVVEAMVRLVGCVPAAPSRGGAGRGTDEIATSPIAPYRIVNIGSSRPIGLEAFIASIEAATGRTAIRRDLPMQPGDVPATFADTTLLQRLTGFTPQTPLDEGVGAFVTWYRDYYRV